MASDGELVRGNGGPSWYITKETTRVKQVILPGGYPIRAPRDVAQASAEDVPQGVVLTYIAALRV